MYLSLSLSLDAFFFQNLLISDQSSVIIKSLSKLPKFFDIVVYPTLLTITCDNDGAKNVIGKEFDLKVIFLPQHSNWNFGFLLRCVRVVDAHIGIAFFMFHFITNLGNIN